MYCLYIAAPHTAASHCYTLAVSTAVAASKMGCFLGCCKVQDGNQRPQEAIPARQDAFEKAKRASSSSKIREFTIS